MKYGNGFQCLDANLAPYPVRVYPRLMPFEYKDGTGDTGWFLLEDFNMLYRDPATGFEWIIRVKGDPAPSFRSAFDFDAASIPRAFMSVVGSPTSLDILVAALGHDLGYCVNGSVTGFRRADWDRFLSEVIEAYGASRAKRFACHRAVRLGGGFIYEKDEMYRERYMRLCEIKRLT